MSPNEDQLSDYELTKLTNILNDETHEGYLEALRVPNDWAAEFIPDFTEIEEKFVAFEAVRSQTVIVDAAQRLIAAGHADIVARELHRNLEVLTTAHSGAAEMFKIIARAHLSGIRSKRQRQHAIKLIKGKGRRSPLYSERINLKKITKMLVHRVLDVSLWLLRIEGGWTLKWGIDPAVLQTACMAYVSDRKDVDALRRIVSMSRLFWVPLVDPISVKTTIVEVEAETKADLYDMGPLKHLKGVGVAVKVKVWKALRKRPLKDELFDTGILCEVAGLKGQENAVSKCLKKLFDEKVLKRHGNHPRFQYTVFSEKSNTQNRQNP